VYGAFHIRVGMALILAAIDSRVRCAIANIPVIDGYESMRLVHGYGKGRLAALLRLIAEDRERRARGEAGGFIPHNSSDPDKEICTCRLHDLRVLFEGAQQFCAELPVRSTIESTELLMQYTVDPYLKRIYHTPVMMLVVEGDEHTPWDLQVDAFNRIGSVRKELAVMTKGATHVGMYANLDFQTRGASAMPSSCASIWSSKRADSLCRGLPAPMAMIRRGIP